MDTAVALPRQIQAQVDAAAIIEAQLLAGASPEIPQAPDPLVEVAPEPVVAVSPPQPEPQPQPIDDWKARYDTLQGKFNAEVPKLYSDLRARDQAFAELQREVAQLKSKPVEPPKVEPLVTDQDDEKFGADLIDAMRRVYREETGPLLRRVETIERFASAVAPQLQQVERVTQDVAQSKEQQYWTAITTAVPDVDAVNVDPKWLAWLSEFDPLVGDTRQVALDKASQRLDSKAVIGIFNLFKNMHPVAAVPQPSSGQAELARQVAPTRSSTTTTVPTGAKTYTGAQYRHWTDHRRVHDTDVAVVEQMVSELESALREGRIKW